MKMGLNRYHGGVAIDISIANPFEIELATDIIVSEQPRMTATLGAALFAKGTTQPLS
jgi:activator of 2-hydroxyglutaryl-CoA dehydratase